MSEIVILDRYKEFYTGESVVLGLDIGIEGIGITIRRGKEWLYSRTLLVDLPEAKALAQRRQFRASRHARKNRRVRMRRLAALFEKHGLPWVPDEVYSRSDPFKLRYRALVGTLASREALSLCIRSCVMHRGYDYGALSREEGEYPWGDSNKFSDAKKWLESEYVDAPLQERLLRLAPELVKKGKELEDADVREWEELVRRRAAMAEQEGIPSMLENYAKKHINDRKARGRNYPRQHVKEHLCTILERHKHLIDDYDAFVEALFLPCNTPANKKKAIFHYNRKTPDEAKRHYESKIKTCPYQAFDPLGLTHESKCGSKGDPMIRRWNVVDFLSNHRFYLKAGKQPMGLQLLPVQGVRVLIEAIEEEYKTQKSVSWRATKVALNAALKPLSIDKKNEWNKGQLEQLIDIVAPKSIARPKRAGMSADAAVALYEQASANGECLDPASIERWKNESGLYQFRQQVSTAEGGIYPQVRALIGTLRKQKKGGGFATTGLLQCIFEKELKDILGGKKTPDYCVIECIKNPALNKEQISQSQSTNRNNKLSRAIKYGRNSNLSHAEALRMRLFEEQGGDKDKPATCPFTGKTLGMDPFSAELELAHLYPDSKGGLYMAENLVLTTREVNCDMKNRTPKQAAEAALPGWLSWKEMKNRINNFCWGKMKRELFCFGDDESIPFPNFNNMTRTAQLARELRRLVAVWMGISSDAEAMRTRIGNVAGVYTAAARRSILGDEYTKDRSNNNNHRYDAAVMTCIPPGEGINDSRYGGIFTTASDGKTNYRRLLCIVPKDLLPDFSALDKIHPPVIKLQSRSKSQSLGDSTFWRVENNLETSQRTPLDPVKMKAPDIYMLLRKAAENAISDKDTSARKNILNLIPSEKKIEKWQLQQQKALKDEIIVSEPLRLRNGTPIKNIRKYNSKGTFENPVGWSGTIKGNVFGQIRNLDASNDRLELWLGWNAKKKCWQYYKRVIPTKSVLMALKRMGLPWRGRDNAPKYLLDLLDKENAKDLKSLVCGVLPPHSTKVGEFRKGDMFEMKFDVDPKKLAKLATKDAHFRRENHPDHIKAWGRISALRSDLVLEVTCVTHKDRKKNYPSKAVDLAAMLKLPEALDKAAKLNLSPPA